MRFVPIKTDDQLDLQALHRVRDRLVHSRKGITPSTSTYYPHPVSDPEILKELKRQMTPVVRRMERARLRAKARISPPDC